MGETGGQREGFFSGSHQSGPQNANQSQIRMLPPSFTHNNSCPAQTAADTYLRWLRYLPSPTLASYVFLMDFMRTQRQR